MPESVMTLFPQLLTNLEAMKIPVRAWLACTDMQMRSITTAFDLIGNQQAYIKHTSQNIQRMFPLLSQSGITAITEASLEGPQQLLEQIRNQIIDAYSRFRQARAGELEFLELFSAESTEQDWTVEYDDTNVILDLPGFRLIDISTDTKHAHKNYVVVFAPRAGHR